eukprot:PLAT9985.1.p1 GENE.PLAT9985.1~~PLAT9985.1.p1  ORF type:complete len:182 (+),score=22.37 PLAT9985.1:17-562(+)
MASAPKAMRSSLGLQILLYFHTVFLKLFIVASLLLLIYKDYRFAFPPGVATTEGLFLVGLAILDGWHIFLTSMGNKVRANHAAWRTAVPGRLAQACYAQSAPASPLKTCLTTARPPQQENSTAVVRGLLLGLLTLPIYLYFLQWQTYITRLDGVLNVGALIFVSLEFVMSIVALVTFSKDG